MTRTVLVVNLAGRRAALRAADVQSVVELDSVVPVPHAPAHVLGLAALRSRTLTVIDAAAALGRGSGARPNAGARVVIADHSGHRYALVVDAIEDVAEQIGEPVAVPGEAGPGWERASQGLIETARGPALLLSLETLLSGPSPLAA
ncbi:MAG: chemotaxis protein CheW [Cypionkella sp.]